MLCRKIKQFINGKLPLSISASTKHGFTPSSGRNWTQYDRFVFRKMETQFLLANNWLLIIFCSLRLATARKERDLKTALLRATSHPTVGAAWLLRRQPNLVLFGVCGSPLGCVYVSGASRFLLNVVGNGVSWVSDFLPALFASAAAVCCPSNVEWQIRFLVAVHATAAVVQSARQGGKCIVGDRWWARASASLSLCLPLWDAE